MDNYPPGAANDPRAPYNQPESIECSVCEGTGEAEDYSECTNCGGTGFIPDPAEPDPDSMKGGPDYD